MTGHRRPTGIRNPLVQLGLSILFAVLVPAVTQSSDLENGFRSPPQEARPSAYWLWLNGYTNRDYFDTELAAFAQQGVGGLCIFDMGARGDSQFCPPTGPPFMAPDSVESIAAAVQAAQRHGLDVQLAPCSSWDLGGSWVQPQHASMALYRSEMRASGPTELDVQFPFPKLPAPVPRDDNGAPAYYRDVAVLAVPEADRLPGHEFIFRLPRGDIHQIDHVVLYNAKTDNPEKYGKLHLFARDFEVAISTTDAQRSSFRTLVSSSLAPHAEPQRFDFDATDARYVRLTVFNGHNPKFDEIQLAEFEIYSTDGINIGGSKSISYTRDAADLVWYSSEAAAGGNWTAANLHDGAKSRPDGIWSFAGPPPLIIPDKSRILNITDCLAASHRLQWSVPDGKWTLWRFVCANTGERLKVPSPKSDGLATDHFNAAATRLFLQTVIDRLEARLGNLPEAGIKQLYLPSYEVVGAKWTPDFLSQFQRYRHYDMTPYLPVFAGCIVESEEQTKRFLYDFEKTLGELLVDAYYRTASATARRAGLGVEAEAGGPGPPVHQVPVDALQALGAIDEMRGEFWPWRPERNGLWVVKETACAAHIYGHRRVHMESFTGFHHWTAGPFFLKASADRAFCEGMNHVVWHTASHQPPEAGQPGWVYGAGTHLTPNLIWWPMSRPFLDYLSRCSFLLQQGHFVGDVCYYYGDQGSNFVPPKHINPALGYGYDYDVVNAEVILNRMSVRDGKITLPDGMQYEILVLPDREDMSLSVLRKLEQLVRQGAVLVGRRPVRTSTLTDYPRRDTKVRELAVRLWGDCDGMSVTRREYGEGLLYWGPSLREILMARGFGPDFQFHCDDPDGQLDFIHRRTADADIYFVRNLRDEPTEAKALFRVADRLPEFWLPETGEIRPCHVYRRTAGGTQLPLQFDAHGSMFVVFRDGDDRPHLDSAPADVAIDEVDQHRVRLRATRNGPLSITLDDGTELSTNVSGLPDPITLSRPWRLRFLSGRGAPKSLDVGALKSWTEFEQERVKHYAGIVRYETAFQVPEAWCTSQHHVRLDLGELWAVGRVVVNDDSLGVLWKPPYVCDITRSLQPGENRLVVEVANTWSNRLVGDAALPSEQRIARTNITRSGTPSKPWKDVPLHDSGLLGPVRLVPTRVVELTR